MVTSSPTPKKTWRELRKAVNLMEVMAADESRVADRLVRLRKEHALTQEAAAARAGVTLRQWQRWEAGAGEPRAGSMQKLVAAFSVDPSDFYAPSAQEEAAATQLDRLEEKIDSLSALVTRLLAAERIESGGMTPEVRQGIQDSLEEVLRRLPAEKQDRRAVA